ncbi:MAG: T9SS type A sorting domain-containing protein, partial [Bacteroidia bacterium]
MKKTSILLLTILFFSIKPSFSQVSKTQVIMINASVQSDGVTLNWPSRTFTGNYLLYKRNNLQTLTWGTPIANLHNTATSYNDATVIPGQACDYYLVAANGSSAVAFGYIYAGNELKEVPYKGGILLVIDSTYMNPLNSEIAQLKNDLSKEGWTVNSIYVGRTSTPPSVKSRIISAINSNNHPTTTALLLGHIPVPYSGGFTGNGSNYPPPDGHIEGSGNHTGAWPADVYYADLDGIWEDVFIDLSTGNQSRHHNVPADGKFDPTKIPSSLELEIGRVDMYDLPAFGVSDTVLLRNYLNRNHKWRTGQISAVERGVIDDNFTGFNLASTGWSNFSSFFPMDSVVAKDYVTELKSKSYLWSYGCGAGSYTSCNGVGNTNSFVNDSLQHIFTILAGSFFGDWDIKNSFLRAPLGRSALASFWGGIPKWYVHTMGLGKHLGYGTRITQNNNGFYFTGQFNYSDSSVHIALMGDPTLCNRHLPPVFNLNATSASKFVSLTWDKSFGNFDGYSVYRLDTANNIYTKVSNYIITDNFYTDSNNYFTGNYRYVVRTIKKETTASGSYYNLGGGSYADVSHTNSLKGQSKLSLGFYPNPTLGKINFIVDVMRDFELYDMAGRMYTVKYQTYEKSIDISHVPAGNY